MKGESVFKPTALQIFVISILSSTVGGGRIEVKAWASIVFPAPGGPVMIMLWPPEAATRSARFAPACPLISPKLTSDSG